MNQTSADVDKQLEEAENIFKITSLGSSFFQYNIAICLEVDPRRR
jgi:hypothetical protein